jgi:hypothetical protein
MKNNEYQLQKNVIKYIKLKYPSLLYCASAGGMRTSMTQAKKMKATGYKKGFPDLFIYEPKGKYHGLALELKIKKGRPTKSQLDWRNELNKRNYVSEITYGFDETIEILDRYLSGKICELNEEK